MSALLCDIRAEAYALQTMLDSNSEHVRNELLSVLRDDHFYTAQPAGAYKRIISQLRDNRKPLWSSILADITLPDTDRKRLDALTAKTKATNSLKEARAIIDVLENFRQARVLYEMAALISESLSDVKSIDVKVLTEKAANAFEKIRSAGYASKHDDKRSDVVVGKLIDKLRKGNRDRIIPTGIREFDAVNGGAMRGTHWVMGGPSGEAKSMTAQNIAMNIASKGFRVCFWSLEMQEPMCWTRSLAYLSGVSITAMEMRQISDSKYDYILDCYKVFQASMRKLGGCFRIECPDVTPTMDKLLAQSLPYGYDVLVIDYLSLLDGMSGDDYWRKLGEAARLAQSHAIANDNVVLTVVQTDDEGKARLSAQIKDNAGLMWTWGVKNDKGKTQSQATDKPAYEKKGIDTCDIQMPKARMQKQFQMRLYRSKAHMQVSSDLHSLQRPWVNNLAYAPELFAQLKLLDDPDALTKHADRILQWRRKIKNRPKTESTVSEVLRKSIIKRFKSVAVNDENEFYSERINLRG
jgi:replicative DNA helicase